MAKLIDSVRHRESVVHPPEQGGVVDRYRYRFWPHGWAVFYVDHWGMVTINSDWGTWGHAWGGSPKTWGDPTFTHFLRRMSSPHYLADKLSYGRTRQVPDPEATEKAMKDHVHGLTMTPEETDELETQIDNFCEGLQDSIDVAYLVTQGECLELHEEFECLHEWVAMKTAPKVVFLTEELLPVFLADLRGTLRIVTPEEWDQKRRKPHGPEITTEAATEGP
jgi:hypothetical protein